MQPFFQSAFLQALGFAIANSLWQVALIWLLYYLANQFLSLTASTKYRLGVFAQITGFVWFISTFWFYLNQYRQAWHLPLLDNASGNNIQSISWNDGSVSSLLFNGMLKAEQVLPFISLAYICLLGFLLIRWVTGYQETKQLSQQGLQKIPVDWRLFVRRISGQLGITKEILIFLSEKVQTPITMGFLKPIILIPVASINHLSVEQLEAVILHELAHIKRHDYLVNLLLSFAEIGLFFNPFTQLLSRSIRKERENSCDDWVLQFQYNATEYAKALLRIAQLQAVPAFAMGATGKKNELLTRVQRMVHRKENRFSYPKQLLAFLVMSGMLCTVAWLTPVAKAHQEHAVVKNEKNNPKAGQRSIAREPMAVSISNPLFNPVFFLSEPLKKEMNKGLAASQESMTVQQAEDNHVENAPSIETIPALVANALEMAAAKFEFKSKDWEKSMAQIEKSALSLEKIFGKDSSLSAEPIRKKVKKDISHSFSNIQEEFERAKKEVAKTRTRTEDFRFDKEKMQQDIRKAMEEVDKLKSLDKLVMNAMDLSATRFYFPQTGKIEKEEKNIREKDADFDQDITEMDSAYPPNQENQLSKAAVPLLPVDIMDKLKAFIKDPEATRFLTETQINGLKNTISEWEKTRFFTKLIPVMYKTKNPDKEPRKQKQSLRL